MWMEKKNETLRHLLKQSEQQVWKKYGILLAKCLVGHSAIQKWKPMKSEQIKEYIGDHLLEL